MRAFYDSDHYVDPRKTYDRISDKVKLGHLLYDRVKGSYVVVDLKVLQEILKFEKSEDNIQKYLPIPINDLWLTLIFNFEKKQLAIHSGTYFTSRDHGFKITCQGGRYMFGYPLREKGLGASATFNLRPQFLFIHELMDILFLMKRQQFRWSDEDLDKISSVVSAE